MLNKKNLWVMTLFSLVVVLSIYYVTMPEDSLIENQKNTEIKEHPVVKNEESTVLVSLKVDFEEEYATELASLQTILTNKKSTMEEKNDAYQKIKDIKEVKGEQEELQNEIEEELKLKSFVKIDGDKINVVIDKKEHDTKLANQIMRLIQSNYENKMNITVKFQSTN